MRNSWAFRGLSGPADHPQTPERGSSLHPTPIPPGPLCPGTSLRELGSGASGCLAELPLSGTGNKSVTRSREGKRGAEARPEVRRGRKARGHWLCCMAGRAAYSLPHSHGFGQMLRALPLHWTWVGGSATRLASLRSQSSRGPCMIRWSPENFSEEAILELGLRGWVEIGGVWR